MSEKNCPSREELLAYLTGTVTGDAADTVSVHVARCPECQAAMCSLRESVQTQASLPPADDPSSRGDQAVPPKPGGLPDVSAPDFPALGQLGEYRLLEKLGEGGMGVVYKALHTELDRVVAVKVLSRGRIGNDQAVARFKREIKAVGRLDHPNIVRAHDAREIDGTHFLVMEYVEGLDLSELAERVGPLRPADACELIRQASIGLQHAHEHGLVHRDVKPSNLMLGDRHQVKLLDLGLARMHATGSEEMTATGQAMGTPDYMAPEQISDSHAVDVRADVYGLGCTFYKLLTGRAPFSGAAYTSAFDKMMGHVSHAAEPVGSFRDDVPAELEAIINRMMAKEPGDRFATPGEVAEAVDRFTSGCDLSAPFLAAKEQATAPRVADRPIAADDGTPPGRRAATRPDAPRANVRSRWPLVAVGVVVLVTVGIGMAYLMSGRPGDDGRGEVASLNVQPDRQAGESGDAAADVVPPALDGWIVLSWTRLGVGRPSLWLFSTDGQARIPVTDDPFSFDVQPHFSPDGRRLVFIRGREPGDPNGVWACNVDGSDLRQLVTATDESERFVSPVWVSNSEILYARDPKADTAPDMEVWQVDLHQREPRLVFRFQDALNEGGGLVTDVAPDGGQLVLIAQTEAVWATADVLVTDLAGRLLHTIWADLPDDYKDTRAIWSPDGRRIAWHHHFTPGTRQTPVHYGVGLAQLGPNDTWAAQLQSDEETFVTPLAWSPDGRHLLCARIDDPSQRLPPATLFLMDNQFQPVQDLFHLETTYWQPGQRDAARLADWAILPPGVKLPETPR